MRAWAIRAKELNRCMQCLTLCTKDKNCIGKDGNPDYLCQHCHAPRTYWNPESQRSVIQRNCKESQTEENSDMVQESQTELQDGKNIIEKLRKQIETLNSKMSSLEGSLESSNATIKCLDEKLQGPIKEQEQELQKVDNLELLCKEKEVELRRLWEQLGKKDFYLEQYRKTSAQLSQSFPAAEQQPCPTSPSNNLEQTNETNSIKTFEKPPGPTAKVNCDSESFI